MTTTVSHLIDAAAELRRQQEEYRRQLLDARLLYATDVDGLYLRSERFEKIVRGIDALVSKAGAGTASETMHFPLLMPRSLLERTNYPRSFPDLTGVVNGFLDTESSHAGLMEALDSDDPDAWTRMLRPTDLGLCSAACHPLYPTQTGTLAEGSRVIEVFGQCFRREPSIDPARMQSFRQHEFVYLGTPEGARSHRDAWVKRALELHRSLGLSVEADEANDPFFGRAGRLLAAQQRSSDLKIEILAPVATPSALTAITSANIHLDHFGEEFGIRLPDGRPAHTACVGFGVERITLALLRVHGLDTDRWDPRVRGVLGW